MPKKKEKQEENKIETIEESVERLNLNCDEAQSEAKDETKVENSQNVDSNNNENKNLSESASDSNNNSYVNDGEGEEENDEDDEGWITPSNLEKVKKMSQVESEQQEINNLELKVACMTSDFAMQVCKFIYFRFIKGRAV